jgi:hypothetical protein
MANRQSLLAARRDPRQPTACQQPATPSPSSYRPPVSPQAVHPARPPARSIFACVRPMAAKPASGRSDRQTQTQHREQRAKASSKSSQLRDREPQAVPITKTSGAAGMRRTCQNRLRRASPQPARVVDQLPESCHRSWGITQSNLQNPPFPALRYL